MAVAMAVSSVEGISLSLDGDNQASLKEKNEFRPAFHKYYEWIIISSTVCTYSEDRLEHVASTPDTERIL